MLVLPIILMLMSSLQSVLAGTAAHNLTELLAVDAVHVNLDPVIKIQADMSKLARTAETLFAEHFPADYVSAAHQQQLPLMAAFQISHSGIIIILSTGFEVDLSGCNFNRHDSLVMHACEETSPPLESFDLLLDAEMTRTGLCANNFLLLVKMLGVLRSIPFEDIWSEYSLVITSGPQPNSPRSSCQHDLVHRFLKYWDGFMEIETKLSASWSLAKYEYLRDLEMLYIDAGRNASIASRLGHDVLSDNWDATEPYRKTLCSKGEEQADNFATTLWSAMFQQPILFQIGMRSFGERMVIEREILTRSRTGLVLFQEELTSIVSFGVLPL
jgi:hypothetical protein